MNSTLHNDQKGFTLVEVLISLAVLVMISLGIYQATVQTYRLRDSLSTEGNFYNTIRFATTILQKDVASIYSPVLALPPKSSKTGTQGNTAINPAMNPAMLGDDMVRTTPYWLPAIDVSGLRPSHFVGQETKMSFVTTSHVRIYRDMAESEFAKVSYEIKRDEQDKKNTGTYVLIRSESPNAFNLEDHRDTAIKKYDLLRGIKSLSLLYYKRDGNTWKTQRDWDNEQEDLKYRFPDMIEMKITLIGPQNQTFDGIYRFRPEIPVNGLEASF